MWKSRSKLDSSFFWSGSKPEWRVPWTLSQSGEKNRSLYPPFISNANKICTLGLYRCLIRICCSLTKASSKCLSHLMIILHIITNLTWWKMRNKLLLLFVATASHSWFILQNTLNRLCKYFHTNKIQIRKWKIKW